MKTFKDKKVVIAMNVVTMEKNLRKLIFVNIIIDLSLWIKQSKIKNNHW